MQINDTDIKKELFLSAFRECGSMTSSASAAGINRITPWRWCKSDAEFNVAFQEAKQEFAELLEGRMFDLIEEQRKQLDYKSNPALLIFALKGAMPHKYGSKLIPANDHAQELLQELRRMYREVRDADE